MSRNFSFFSCPEIISFYDRRANLHVSWVQETRTYYFVKCRGKKWLLRAEDLQRSDGCELTPSNVRLWISAKRDINHFQMVPPTSVTFLYKCLGYCVLPLLGLKYQKIIHCTFEDNNAPLSSYEAKHLLCFVLYDFYCCVLY